MPILRTKSYSFLNDFRIRSFLTWDEFGAMVAPYGIPRSTLYNVSKCNILPTETTKYRLDQFVVANEELIREVLGVTVRVEVGDGVASTGGGGDE